MKIATARRIAAAFTVCSLLLSPVGRAHAAESCPDIPDDEAGRRALAKEWFAKAEEAEAAGDRQAAVRRYACSLKVVPHPSTAYNLGTAAEKSGDVSMAADAFRMYLNLSSDAADRAAVQARIARLDAKVAELRQQLAKAPPGPEPPPPAAVIKPEPAARTAAPSLVTAPAVPPPPQQAPRRHARAGWITLGAGAGALGAAVALNLVARAKMRDCFDLAADPAQRERALSACDAAKPFAYGSYGLFAAAGALGLTGLTLLLWTGEDDSAVALAPASNGLLFTGRF